MKRKAKAFLAAVMALQLSLSGTAAVNADETSTGVGETYTAPESTAVTYNMNLDWKFYDTGTTVEIWSAMSNADKDGKKFYEVDYDDSDWETVSIPHGIGGGTNSFNAANYDAGGGYRSVLLYRKTFDVPQYAEGSKVFFELEGIRQAAYVWVNGEKVGYYEAGIAAMGFDLTSYVEPGEQAVIAICNDGTTARGTTGRIPYETVPGAEWGSSYTPDNYDSYMPNDGSTVGAQFQWNMKDFNEPLIGLEYDAYLYIKGSVYQTLPLYNNLKTTGNYIYGSDFDIRSNEATINVKAEVRNESGTDGNYTLDVAVVNKDGTLAYEFESDTASVAAAADAGVVYETAVESDVYSDEKIADPTGTTVNTPDVTYITASYAAEGVRFWSPDDPYLYTVYTILKDADGNVVDVAKTETGFRKVSFSKSSGVEINDKGVWLRGYAQRSTDEWAVIGNATDWLQDYDMKLLKANNANFIRWMHVAPKPAQVRSSDRYGVVVVCPAGDKEGDVSGRQWSQRAEAMRDAMIYFRNSPSVLFWETGNSAISADHANDMKAIYDTVDPYGMRFIGARSTKSADQLNYENNYAGTMYGNYASTANSAMETNGIYGPIMETEYARDEAPRRVWDDYSPPDYDYVNKYLTSGDSKKDGYDKWDETQEDITVNNVKEYSGYYTNRNGQGDSLYSAEAMMVWSDSNMHTRNTASENCRTSGRVDPVRQTKEMYNGMTAAQSSTAAVDIIGHWSYPEVSDDTYNYYNKESNGTYAVYDTSTVLKRDPTSKTVYVIGSADVKKVALYRVDGDTETLLGEDDTPDSTFVYAIEGVDVTQGDAVKAYAYNARGEQIAVDEIERTYDAVTVKLTPHTAVKTVTADDGTTTSENDWRADGSDIVYFDLEVVDENGNVCALNYDKVELDYEGEGVFLGGYNSGMGANCFQNSAESAGLSNYFGGAKDGVSTLGQKYVYAENGTNRIFVRSTRTAGTFKLKAKLDGGQWSEASVTSTAIESEGGLTLTMQSYLDPGVTDPVVIETSDPMKPLMKNKLAIDWANVIVKQTTDTTDYYDTYINGSPLTVTAKTRMGQMDTLFGPITEIMDAVKAADSSAAFSYTIDETADPITVAITASDGSVYTYQDGVNTMYKDGNYYSETVEAATMENGVMIANIPMLMEIIDVGYTIDTDEKILYITTEKEAE